MAKLHRALVHLETSEIGVSFPRHINKPASKRTLGDMLRLHANSAALESLMALNWLQGIRDHTQLDEPALAPIDAPHYCVRRRQFKTSAERLRRRRMKRKGETEEQAKTAIPNSVEQHPDLPYLQLRSSSTGQPFTLFIEHSPHPPAKPPQGGFNSYGLGGNATIPWF